MRYYATLLSDTGKEIGKGGNEFIRVDLKDKTRSRVATVIMRKEKDKLIVDCSSWKGDENIQTVTLSLEKPRTCFYCGDEVTIPKSTLCNYHHFFKFPKNKRLK